MKKYYLCSADPNPSGGEPPKKDVKPDDLSVALEANKKLKEDIDKLTEEKDKLFAYVMNGKGREVKGTEVEDTKVEEAREAKEEADMEKGIVEEFRNARHI